METSTSDCTWCKAEYAVASSRARDQRTFCSKKCEMEARFWLFRLFYPDEIKPSLPDSNNKALPEGRAPKND
jgi:hypothetical protein